MYDITFRTQGGTTTNSATTCEDAVKEAARILADQTDERWPMRALARYTCETPFKVHGQARVNGTLTPIPWTITITSDQPV